MPSRQKDQVRKPAAKRYSGLPARRSLGAPRNAAHIVEGFIRPQPTADSRHRNWLRRITSRLQAPASLGRRSPSGRPANHTIGPALHYFL